MTTITTITTTIGAITMTARGADGADIAEAAARPRVSAHAVAASSILSNGGNTGWCSRPGTCSAGSGREIR